MANIFDAFTKVGFKTSEPPPPKKNSYQPKKNNPPQKKSSEPATAPYNFVPLPEKVLPAQFDSVEGFREHIGAAGNISGEISLDIEALTPLFIGGSDNAKSFAPVGTPIIPGSSLRGMFKNIFKVVTCGAFRGQTTSQGKGEDFNDEHIYFRCLMGVGRYPWTKELNKHYLDLMTDKDTGKKKAHPGFLICTVENKYFIAPSIADGKPMNYDRKEDRILIREYEEKFHVTIPERNSSCVKWDGTKAYIITGSQASCKLHDAESYKNLKGDDKKKAGKQFIRFTRLDYVDWSREHWIALPEEVRTSYEHDRNRRGVNLFTDKGILKRAELERLTKKNLPDVKTLIPCHFLEERGQITAFGHGQCFRIPYQNRIANAVPENLRDEKIIDFADAVFGRAELWASRVYFEDATPVDGKVSELATAKAHPLMQPNPTSYQLYLKQGGELKHWDTVGAQIRGYKFYWHNYIDDDDWHANNFELSENKKRINAKQEPLTKDMTPLAKGNKFAAKIRFKNLSAVELGALMMIFDLYGSTDAAYKIGQGKPLGFGSIRIKPKLFVEDETAYTELFGADGWQNPCREKNPAEYLDAFKDYLRACDRYEIWRKVMVELKKILDWSLTKQPRWSRKVATMRGNIKEGKTMELDERFRQRETLQTIFDVIKC
ncbi:MAG: TIGR03986 family CRISPR-associated RAMP protein [Quinella sp. 3Q1]|nr:TIGR03986 family CRISPR-associated RAMP protein [Quinella sp. 3Q1]